MTCGNVLTVRSFVAVASLVLATALLTPLQALQVTENSLANRNREIVVAMYLKLFNQKDIATADEYIGEKYVQHNPLVPDGKEALKNYVRYLKTQTPDSSVEIKRVIA